MLALLLTCTLAAAPNQVRQMSTLGEATVQFAPKDVVAAFSLSAQGRDAATARKQLDEKLTKFILAVKAVGLESRNLTLSDPSLNPDSRGGETISETATRVVTLTLTDLARANEVLTAALRAGGVSVGSVQLRTTEFAPWGLKARAAAATSARDRAKTIVEALGARLGLPITASDSTPSVELMQIGTVALLPDGSLSVDVASRQMSARSQITVQWDIEAP